MNTDEVKAELLEQPRGEKVTMHRTSIEELIAECERLQREITSKKTVTARRLVVFAPKKRGETTHWTRAGVAFENRDGTITLKLDVLPLDGELHVRAPLGGEVA